MKIKTVGTGSIWTKERSACTLIDNKILVDCGNGTTKTLMEQDVDIYKIEVVLITHFHMDHFLDLPMFILTRSLEENHKILKIYGPNGTQENCEEVYNKFMSDGGYFTDIMKKANVKFFESKELVNEEAIDNYYISSYLVEHGILNNAYGYTVKNNNKVVGLSGDSGYCESIVNIVKNSDIAVLDTSFLTGNRDHMGIDNIEKICINYSNKKIISTHMSISSRAEALKRDIPNLSVPIDGQEFEI